MYRQGVTNGFLGNTLAIEQAPEYAIMKVQMPPELSEGEEGTLDSVCWLSLRVDIGELGILPSRQKFQAAQV